MRVIVLLCVAKCTDAGMGCGGSLFYWSIGIVPFKDNFWSTTVQPGNPYGDQTTEPNVVLQALVMGLLQQRVSLA